ncbi:hypothetical protein NQZ68_003852 [Dissostichus eleginoides]|nr:hypothetical protein NQZ68_003852 [Dissostichus eleginoides]
MPGTELQACQSDTVHSLLLKTLYSVVGLCAEKAALLVIPAVCTLAAAPEREIAKIQGSCRAPTSSEDTQDYTYSPHLPPCLSPFLHSALIIKLLGL